MSEKSDLLSRRLEFKYVFPHGDVASLRTFLRGVCQAVVHRHRVSTVRSIYFDDPKLGSCHANLNGTTPRRKLRLRWYDGEEPDGDLFWEVKWRRNRMTGKQRFRLQVPSGFLNRHGRDVVSSLYASLPGVHAARLASSPDPTVLVQYRREHFLLVGAAVRFTLDYDIRFIDQTSSLRLRLSGPSGGRHAREEVILEAKCSPSGKGEVVRALRPLGRRPARFSKYVQGCHDLGLVSA